MRKHQQRICLVQADSLRESDLMYELEVMGYHVLRVFEVDRLPLVRDVYYPTLVITHHIYPAYVQDVFDAFHHLRTPIIGIVHLPVAYNHRYAYYHPYCKFLDQFGFPNTPMRAVITELLEARYIIPPT